MVKNDYVVIQLEGTNKKIGGKVVRVEGKTVRVQGIDAPHLKKSVADCKASQIIVNLGQDPAPGKVYGVDFTHLYKGKTVVPKIDLRLNWFYSPEKEQRESIERAFRIVHKKLSKLGLSFLVENDNTEWEIQGHKSSKYSGRYWHPKDPVTPGRLQICPNMVTAPEYPYVIAHELGHRLHLRYAPEFGINAKWLHVFNTSIKLVSIDKKTSSTLLEALLSGDTRPSKFASELETEDRIHYKWLLRYIASGRSVSIHDLDDLFNAEAFDEIRTIWPIRSIPKKDLQPVLTEYACKNVKELVAESFAFYITGRDLPKKLTKLIEKTISIGKQNQRNPE